MLMLFCSMRSFSSFLVLLLYQVLFAQVAISDTPPVRIGALMALTGQYSIFTLQSAIISSRFILS